MRLFYDIPYELREINTEIGALNRKDAIPIKADTPNIWYRKTTPIATVIRLW
jgi:hypothetical protein